MKTTPKSLRLQIGIFGRTNVGKSSFLNMVAGQDVAITSPVPGTTTDVVEKTMELLPVGPVVFLDTAGLDDASELGGLRVKKTHKIFDRSDVIVLLTEAEAWNSYEDMVIVEAGKRAIPVIVCVNKIDVNPPTQEFMRRVAQKTPRMILVSSVDLKNRDAYVNPLKKHLLEVCPEDYLQPPPLIGDLIPKTGLAALIVPIDKEAPKGRIILPQVHTIRDCLDHRQAALVVNEVEYKGMLAKLKALPDIAVCDSQVVGRMVADTPAGMPCTTFSILFARSKGDLVELAKGAAHIKALKPGDRILIAESCSHHPIEDDIGRVKLPRWLRTFVGGELKIETCAGRDYPEDLKEYRLIIHCGGCMITRREMLARIEKAREAGVPITNYGVAVSVLQGVLDRTLSPFPAALEAYRKELARIKKGTVPAERKGR
ncbi:MAG: [FeFe] hydrogenase H-cluster maturation GTPase HydF [Candidatus Omnitrophica bacterium]|nr:[FeFe] hydrogenase H-cluster maturation GTPase HydF [Candidatus Omnitrophota bacterium]